MLTVFKKNNLQSKWSVIPHHFWFTFYDVIATFGVLIARVFAFKHDKLKRTLEGRGKGMKSWRIGKENNQPCVMIHVASAGEYEGTRPLIEMLLDSGEINVAVSFSSPSAKKPVNSTEGLWACGFLPLDFLYQQLKMLVRIDPTVILIFKHDFWPNLIRASKALQIPIGIVNGNFHSKSKRNFPGSASFHRCFMKYLDFVWTVSEEDLERVKPLLAIRTEAIVGGDSRYDRVVQRVEKGMKRFSNLKAQLADRKVIIGGSTWEKGEDIIWDSFEKLSQEYTDLFLIIAPHEPTEGAIARNINRSLAMKHDYSLLSDLKVGSPLPQVLILDRVGVLADIYALGWVAYVGGGFGKGVHSVIEPAAHGLPVCFGPNYHVSHEASLLIKNRGGFVIRESNDLSRIWKNWLSSDSEYNECAEAAMEIVSSNTGATEKVFQKIQGYLS